MSLKWPIGTNWSDNGLQSWLFPFILGYVHTTGFLLSVLDPEWVFGNSYRVFSSLAQWATITCPDPVVVTRPCIHFNYCSAESQPSCTKAEVCLKFGNYKLVYNHDPQWSVTFYMTIIWPWMCCLLSINLVLCDHKITIAKPYWWPY